MKIQSTIDVLQARLRHFLTPDAIEALYLYGSIVEGKLRVDSDIDIAMLAPFDADDMERLELLSRLEGIFVPLFRESGFCQEVSILDLRSKYISIELQYKIITEGSLVYQKDSYQRFEFENAVKREYFDFIPYLTFLRKKKIGHIPQKA